MKHWKQQLTVLRARTQTASLHWTQMLCLFLPRNFASAAMQHKFINVATFNARSICNKLLKLHRFLYHENQHVVLITETWLNSNIRDSLLDPERKYHIFRCDRSDRRGGGVCILVNHELNAVCVPIPSSYSDIELLCIDILCCSAKCRFIGVYTLCLKKNKTLNSCP